MAAQDFATRDGRVVRLRPLRNSDLDSLFVFANKLAEEKRVNPDLGVVSFDRRMTRESEQEFLDETIRDCRTRNGVSVAAFAGGKMVGNCDVTRRRFKDVRHTGTLGIVILSEYRGVGLGEAMIRRALSEAKSLGVWLVELDVFSTNRRARALYRKMGFRKSGAVPMKIKRNGVFTDSVNMYARLDVH
ncbi:MAG: GNAT family N-acetyltransferase [Thaumarchaeota archaeon]|nr:GNAT family N-acetyltransferase [Nitrososphaerota archaeon]